MSPSRPGDVHARVRVSTAVTGAAAPVPAALPWYTVQDAGSADPGAAVAGPAAPPAAQASPARATIPAGRQRRQLMARRWQGLASTQRTDASWRSGRHWLGDFPRVKTGGSRVPPGEPRS